MPVVRLEQREEIHWACMRERGDHSDGWAALPFCGKKPHWFRFLKFRGTVEAFSLCGLAYHGPVDAQIEEPGNFPRCRRCIASLRKLSCSPSGS